MTPPTYRGSDLDNFITCPFVFGSNLLRAARKATETQGELDAYLASYVCPEGLDWVLNNCGTTPVPLLNRVTQIGTQFHRFAEAYGKHLKRIGVDSDMPAAELVARGLATVDGDFVADAYNTMLYWASLWEHDPSPAITALDVDLATGSFERGHEVYLMVGDVPVVYSLHPDFAKLTDDGTKLQVWDWKSGLRSETYDPRKPDKQLLRYAWAFSQLYPTIREVNLYLWFVNPKHPLCEEPLRWEIDLAEGEISSDIIAAPILATRLAPDFAPNVGCWLCNGFCEWSAHCDDSDAVQHFLDLRPEDALAAYQARKASYAVSAQINSKRAALKRIVDAYVAQNGPLVVGEDEFENDITYGPKKMLSATVPDVAAAMRELSEIGREDVLDRFTIEGARALAEDLGMTEPFEEQPLESIRLKWRVTTPEEDPAANDAAPKKPRKPRKTLPQAAAEPREIKPPEMDEELRGAF